MARGGWFFVLEDSFTRSGADSTRGLVFLFGGCSGVGGEFFHTLRRDGTRKEGLGCVWRFFAEKCYFAL